MVIAVVAVGIEAVSTPLVAVTCPSDSIDPHCKSASDTVSQVNPEQQKA